QAGQVGLGRRRGLEEPPDHEAARRCLEDGAQPLAAALVAVVPAAAPGVLTGAGVLAGVAGLAAGAGAPRLGSGLGGGSAAAVARHLAPCRGRAGCTV